MKKSLLSIVMMVLVGYSYAYYDEGYRRRSGTTSAGDERSASCAPANEKLFMEFNNVKALIETAGFLWQDRATEGPGYEFPKGSNSFLLFSGALWMGGEDINGQLKLAAHRFREGNDFWAGPLGDLHSEGNYNPFVKQNAENTLVRSYGAATIAASVCNEYDRFFTIRKSEVVAFITWWNCDRGISNPADCEGVVQPSEEIMERIRNWPAHGNTSIGQDEYLAPFYDNSSTVSPANGEYRPMEDGDYPWYDIEGDIDCENDRRVTLYGDETHWWVFNDNGNIHTETEGKPIGMEVRAQAFSFASDDEINDMTFYNYELINRGTTVLTNTYFGQYVDPDIGNAFNDYVGCDVERGLGYAYNGEISDEGGPGQKPYGSYPPAVGIDFFEGPYQDNDGIDNPIYIADSVGLAEVYAQKGIPYSGLGIGYGDKVVDNERFGMQRFVYYDNGDGPYNDPQTATDYYKYLEGKWKNNEDMVFGGRGILGTPGATIVPTKFLFPGDSDPLGWGTYPNDLPSDEPWTENSAGTPPGDRRFVQSSGPFTLKPGAVNNITVGVVIGRSNDSDIEAPLRALKIADSKAQALFDNCFDIVDPPAAPILRIQEMENELILTLSDPPGVKLEEYEEEDFSIITPSELADSGVYYDNKYRFEGFQIYQMADELASVSDIGDLSKARLVAQTDIINGVGKLVNYIFDEEDQISIPEVMVRPAGGFELDQGLRRSFRVTEDLFASGDRRLVNHKKYYYIAVSYAYNNYKTYDLTSPNGIDGQKEPYLRSRLSGLGGEIRSSIGIPHDPSPEADGRIFTTQYGFQPEITQLEGIGNGGNFLELTASTVNSILANGRVDHPVYQNGAGPIDVKVIDPLELKGGHYTLGFGYTETDFNANKWWITRAYEDENGVMLIDTVRAERSISVLREQLILPWGISVTINQQYYEEVDEEPFTAPIGATITFADSSLRWMTFAEDDDSFYPSNWIRSGNTEELANHKDIDLPENPNCVASNWIYQPCHYDDWPLDKEEQLYEQLLDGGIAPFRLIGKGTYGLPYGFPGEDVLTPWYETNTSWFSTAHVAQLRATFDLLHEVDIIITADQSKWTRCPVLEMNDNRVQTEHNDFLLQPRSDASVDKEGLSAAEGGNAAEANLVSETGMGWFPGYALDVNTGERLNMAFSENSWLKGDNGDDMIWNPSSNYADNVGLPVFGGMHYVYVFGAGLPEVEEAPIYDQGKWLREKLNVEPGETGVNADYYDVWRTCYWVMEPMLARDGQLLATDVKISTRIKKPYEERSVNGLNEGFPLYEFGFDNPSLVGNANRLESVIDRINIVPNPYYAYSEYEISKLDNRVKITNLPERCTITIFNLQGALVRSFEKDDPLTSVDWDLKNHSGVPIAGGLYFVHIAVEIPDESGQLVEHEKVLKWYGALRQPDLDNL